MSNQNKSILYFTLTFLFALIALYFRSNLQELYVYYTFNLSYLFTESITQYKQYYPKFGVPLFIFFRSIVFGGPILLLILSYKFKKHLPQKAKTIIHHLLIYFNYEEATFWWKRPLIFFVLGLIVTLLFYIPISQWEPNYQLWLTKVFLGIQLIYFLIFLLANFSFVKQKFKVFLFEPVLPYSIGFTRILFFSYLFLLYLTSFYDRGHLLEGLDKVPLPGIGWLVETLPVNAEIFTYMCYIGAVACIFIVIGFKTRFFLLINAVVIFYVMATPNFFGKLWHEQIVIWISWIMAFSSCFDVLSIDSLISKRRLKKSPIYGFHLKIIWLHFGMIYFFAGFYKLWLCGFDWALSSSMVNQIHLEWFEHYNKTPTIRIDYWPHLLMFGGLMVILFELFYFAFLLNKKTRWISAIGGLVMHNCIGYIMYIPFLHLLQAFYIVFIPWNTILLNLKLIKKSSSFDNEKVSFRKWTLAIPLFILGMNFMYGVFRIDSYPFSIYPVYAAIVPKTFKYFEYEVLDKNYKQIDVHALGKITDFRWESYSRFEPEIISKYEKTGIIDTANIIQQWQRWQNWVPTLQNIDSIEVFAAEIYLDPEKQHDTISKKFLFLIDNVENNEAY